MGERTNYATALVDSPARAAKAGTAVGTMTFRLSVEPVDDAGQAGGLAGAAGAAGGGANVTPPPAGEVPIVVDFARQRASLAMGPPGAAPEPVVVLDGTRVFVRRGSTGGISSRRWVVLDLANVEHVSAPEGNDLSQRTGLLLVAVPGPLHLLELLAGSLTGSARQPSPTTFAANVSREKADRELELDDHEIELRDTEASLVALRDEVQPATATLDAEGRPTAFDIRLRPRLRRDLDIQLLVTTRLTYQPATVEIPAPDDTLEIETEGQLLAELATLNRALSGKPAEGTGA
jgi:hypothetical protein